MDYIAILGDSGFLACRECKYSILPSSLNYHFRRTPHGLSTDIREEILSEARKYPSLIWEASGIKDSEIPSSFPFFFCNLALYSDGLACQDCPYIARSTRGISKHYRESHEWENPRGKGRIIKTSLVEVPWESSVHCQQFFRSIPGHSYFRVNPKRPFLGRETRPREASLPEDVEDRREVEIRSESSRPSSRNSQGI